LYVVLGYIVDKYCLGFDRGVIPVYCAWLYCWQVLFRVWQRSGSCMVLWQLDYIIGH